MTRTQLSSRLSLMAIGIFIASGCAPRAAAPAPPVRNERLVGRCPRTAHRVRHQHRAGRWFGYLRALYPGGH